MVDIVEKRKHERMKKVISAKVDWSFFEEIIAYCEKHGITVSDCIILALRRLLGKESERERKMVLDFNGGRIRIVDSHEEE